MCIEKHVAIDSPKAYQWKYLIAENIYWPLVFEKDKVLGLHLRLMYVLLSGQGMWVKHLY